MISVAYLYQSDEFKFTENNGGASTRECGLFLLSIQNKNYRMHCKLWDYIRVRRDQIPLEIVRNNDVGRGVLKMVIGLRSFP